MVVPVSSSGCTERGGGLIEPAKRVVKFIGQKTVGDVRQVSIDS